MNLEFWPWWGEAIAVICPLFVGEGEILDGQNKRVATVFDVSTPEELERLRPEEEQAENIVVNLLDWQVCLWKTAIWIVMDSLETCHPLIFCL